MRLHSSFFLVTILSSMLLIGGKGTAEDASTSPASAAGKSDESGLEHARKAMAAGKYADARKEYEAIVKADVQTLGSQDPKTLVERVELAVSEGKTGDAIKAEDELRELLAIYNRRRGPEHEETLICRSALAELLIDVGRPHEAEKEYREVLENRERLLGADSIEVARVRRSLGDALSAAIEFGPAITEYEKAEPVFEHVLGAEHPETLLNRSNLAMARGEHQQFEAAARELKAILAIREKTLGSDDVSVLMTCYQIGRVLGAQKQFAEALTYATRAADGFQKLGASSRTFVQAEKLRTAIQSDLAAQADSKQAAKPAFPQ